MSTAPQLVIPCHSADFLRWFLGHTRVSVVYVSALPLEQQYPAELRQVASEISDKIDLAITGSTIARAVVSAPVNDGDTLLFLGHIMRERVPSLIEKPESLLLDALLSMNQDYRKLKQQGRAALVRPPLVLLATEAGLLRPRLHR